MEVFECIKARRSVRSFSPNTVPDDALAKILEAATWAPSSGNLQNWEFVVVKEQEAKNQIARSCQQGFIATAPVVIVVCSNNQKVSNYGRRGEEFYAVQNTAASIQNMLLAAHALGIGTCWVGAFDEAHLSLLIGLPNHVKAVAVIPMGYPAEKPRIPPREPSENLVHLNKY